jgi:hypothetical protein
MSETARLLFTVRSVASNGWASKSPLKQHNNGIFIAMTRALDGIFRARPIEGEGATILFGASRLT